MTRHLKRDFKCIFYNLFMHLFFFYSFFIYLHILDIKIMWLSIWTGCGLRGRKEMMSVISVPPNRIAKTMTVFKQIYLLSVIGLTSDHPKQK